MRSINLHAPRAAAGLLVVAFAFPVAAGGLSTNEQAGSDVVAVFRISGELFEKAINRKFSRNQEIAMQVLDIWAVGDAHFEGTASANFAGSSLEEPLTIEINGKIKSSAVGSGNLVTAGARTYGTFHSLIGIQFDGEQFQQVPTMSHAHMESTVDWVKAKRRSIGWRLFERIAIRVAPRMTPKYDHEGERLASQQIEEIVALNLKPILGTMNAAIKMERALAELASGQGYEQSLSKTDTYLQIHFAPMGNQRMPPDDQLISDAPIEIWVHSDSHRPWLATTLVAWQQAREALAELIFGARKSSDAASDRFRITPVGDWDVIQFWTELPKIAVSGVGN